MLLDHPAPSPPIQGPPNTTSLGRRLTDLGKNPLLPSHTCPTGRETTEGTAITSIQRGGRWKKADNPLMHVQVKK
jgi:hypothetical protein